jgi:hypothetical protein
MKIRTGFVSNSSSSSFCIFGAVVPNDDSPIKDTDIVYEYGISDYAEQILAGARPWDMKEDETRKQFEERITAKIKEIFGDLKCFWHSDGGYNG